MSKLRVSKILIISPETYPKVKVGGLGKVTAGLYKGLGEMGVEVKLVGADENIYSPLAKKETEVKNRWLGKKAVVKCSEENWWPDWVWCHDWGGVWSADEFSKYSEGSKIVWTVHSPIRLGGYGSYAYAYDYADYSDSDKPVDWGDSFFEFSALVKKGIDLADKVTTVSGTYARELDSDELFSKADIEGVGLGLNLDNWNAKEDRLIERRLKNVFDWGAFKKVNKRKAQEIFRLPVMVDKPLFVFVSRLVSQKGLDILLDVLPEFLANNEAQFVFLGDGKQEYKRRLGAVVKKFPDQLAVKLVADFDLPHQIYAGGDFLVLPSITEPFGLVVAEAKRYGVVPIVYKTGGLADQVSDKVDGFCFDKYGKLGLMKKLVEAMASYGSSWQERVRQSLAGGVKGEREMCRDFLSVLYENRL